MVHIILLVLLVLVPINRRLSAITPAQALSLAATCNDTEWRDTADTAFKFYARLVEPLWSAEAASRSDQAAQAATEGEFNLNLQGSKQQCLVEYVYHASRRTVQLGRRFKVCLCVGRASSARHHHTLQANHDCRNVRDRMYIILLVLEKLVSKQPLHESLTHDFRFWYVPQPASMDVHAFPTGLTSQTAPLSMKTPLIC